MIHKTWNDHSTIKQIKCTNTEAEKFKVENVLTPGNVYDVKNETDEFYFVIDDSGKMGGFYKNYFKEL
ncbi:DUF6501 family protein [Tenuibacillus multivorans]|uniref:Uncharacterized protein n=1 Tax=Tenuibacillus multivorans TaxID=237069 RepID=A0A1H0CPQ4_9BACI|nr:DUF6501 family protein [Tenuibacillus multivorans]GEL76213.1 hypothetical protein TMU01_04480 [Tenuibacillus multivorans]SDN59887.1 hypothetical protein SAMN05216498_2621 [Tenuibacillus multivorans]